MSMHTAMDDDPTSALAPDAAPAADSGLLSAADAEQVQGMCRRQRDLFVNADKGTANVLAYINRQKAILSSAMQENLALSQKGSHLTVGAVEASVGKTAALVQQFYANEDSADDILRDGAMRYAALTDSIRLSTTKLSSMVGAYAPGPSDDQ
jgi:hypothetical protein